MVKKNTATLTAELVEKNEQTFCHYSCTAIEKCAKGGNMGCLHEKDMNPSLFSVDRPNCPGANYFSIDHWSSIPFISFSASRSYRALIPIKSY